CPGAHGAPSAERRLPPALGHAPAGGRDPARARRRVTPLDHLRLLDLSRQLPGPFCSTLLADLGADVLTIAAPGDPFGTGIPFLAPHKPSMTLNLKSDAGGPPVIPGVQIADIGAGSLMAAVGILTALIARERTGRGQLVDIAMLDGAVAWNVYHTLLYLLSGRPPERGKTQLTGHFPCYAVYETRDGRHVTVGAYAEHFWATRCRDL